MLPHWHWARADAGSGAARRARVSIESFRIARHPAAPSSFPQGADGNWQAGPASPTFARSAGIVATIRPRDDSGQSPAWRGLRGGYMRSGEGYPRQSVVQADGLAGYPAGPADG